MTLPLLLAAEVHQTASGPLDRFLQMLGHFGVDWRLILIQLVSFLVLFGVLYKFGIMPTLTAMEERSAKIATGLKHAEEIQAKLAAAQQEGAAIVKKSQVEATRIVDDARKAAKDFFDKQTQEASGKSNDIITKAHQAIELEYKKMLADARDEIPRLVVITAERVLGRRLSDPDRAAYRDTASRELTN